MTLFKQWIGWDRAKKSEREDLDKYIYIYILRDKLRDKKSNNIFLS